MQIEIIHRPSYAMAVVAMDASETIRAEGGAMLSMSPNMTLETKTQGGMLKGLKRSLLGGESFFMNTYTATGGPGQISLAPALPGDVVHQKLTDRPMMVQSGSYVASSAGIEVETKWGGAKTFFSGEGLFMLRLHGQGDLIMSSYGAVHELTLAAGETQVVDTSHMVAFEEGMGYQVRKVGGIKSTLFSGEGFVVDLTGPGRAYIQTRSPGAFLSWLIPQLPSPKS